MGSEATGVLFKKAAGADEPLEHWGWVSSPGLDPAAPIRKRDKEPDGVRRRRQVQPIPEFQHWLVAATKSGVQRFLVSRYY